MKCIEQKLKMCPCCGRKTVHARNASKTGFVMVMVHLFLILVTAGFWLLVLVLWHLLTSKIGGWICEECGK